MSGYYFPRQSQPSGTASPVGNMSAAASHLARSSRRPRLSPTISHQQPQHQKHFLSSLQSTDVENDTAVLSAYLDRLESCLSFDDLDDETFCPTLVSFDNSSYAGSVSEGSSLASNSPLSSPTQSTQGISRKFALDSSPSFVHSTYVDQPISRPIAARTRNPIPIVNPETGVTMLSPAPSPPRMPQNLRQ